MDITAYSWEMNAAFTGVSQIIVAYVFHKQGKFGIDGKGKTPLYFSWPKLAGDWAVKSI